MCHPLQNPLLNPQITPVQPCNTRQIHLAHPLHPFQISQLPMKMMKTLLVLRLNIQTIPILFHHHLHQSCQLSNSQSNHHWLRLNNLRLKTPYPVLIHPYQHYSSVLIKPKLHPHKFTPSNTNPNSTSVVARCEKARFKSMLQHLCDPDPDVRESLATPVADAQF